MMEDGADNMDNETMNDVPDIEGADKTSVRRLHSTSSDNHDEPPVTFDPYRALERSQSEAALLKKHRAMKDEIIKDTVSAEGMGVDIPDVGHHNVSECSKVYLDLSRAEAYENVNDHHLQTQSLFRSASGRHLETIPQDEELQTDDIVRFSLLSERSVSTESTSSSSSFEDWSQRGYLKSLSVKDDSKSAQKMMKLQKSPDYLTKAKTNMKSTLNAYTANLKQKIKQLQMGSVQEQQHAMREMSMIIDQAWAIPAYGRDLAYSLCDVLKNEKALEIIVKNCASANSDLMKCSAKLLERVLTTSNRKRVAEIGMEIVVKMAVDSKGETELARSVTGILESLFKISEDHCAQLIKLGALDVIVYWCRCNDRMTLRHCAMAVSNLALYGGNENQEEMIKHKVPEWLLPLAFNDDDSVRYYACLAISVLVANKEIEKVVQNSGTLELVLPFISSHTPSQFARSDLSHRHGRSKGWLKRLVVLLSSKREEAQSLAAFHFAMETGIKLEQGKKEMFYEIGAIEPLKRVASSPNTIASKLAGEALKILGENIPHKLSQQVPVWTVDDVVFWVQQIGYGDYASKFGTCKVDGDLLLTITDEELSDSIGVDCRITRKRFLRDLKELKITADYTSCDPSGLDDWLQEVGSEFTGYTYPMLKSGVDKHFLPSMTEEDLITTCGVENSVHRKKIMQKIRAQENSLMTCESLDSVDTSIVPSKPMDVFISYRRANGSQLASLLKVHLQLRGFTVFLDIEKLRAGKFDENLLQSVRTAKNFLLVLTPESLNRCIGDDEQRDWVHKEIVAALDCHCNIIPLMDSFSFPPAEQLPEDMRQICYFNGIRWIHDYQDACVDKLEKFLRGEISTSKKSALFHLGSSQEGITDTGGKYSSSEDTSPCSDSISANRAQLSS
ncbi:hypothetical protein FSP39_024537 [Pinctada imbricata]|uniref:ADP-ribosyl cyclase/cyclic ADP-ribose hydrolase n=1 Tax=Pinctada imbricata TaxID=66713 RepID=A0AA88XH99_PINIB|nr:hypothetical protein FSP39_024537 [Pinctada imbricata]